MAYSLIVSEPADKSIDEILDYIDKELDNPDAALSWLNRLEAVFDNLIEHPEMYPLARDPRIAMKGIRIAPLENHIVAYRADNDDEMIFVVNVFFGARQYQEFL